MILETEIYSAVKVLGAIATIAIAGTGHAMDVQEESLKLLPDDGGASQWFGFSVAIFDQTGIVGAMNDDDNGPFSGSVYLFNANCGMQLAKLLPNDGSSNDRFGGSVAISGTTAIVGAHRDDDNGTDSGSVYLFDVTSGQQTTKLLANDGGAGHWFGWSVAISDSIAIVGSPRDDDNGHYSGSVYLFDATSGRQIAKLLPDVGGPGYWFGESVAISGTVAIVGSREIDETGSTGAAYLFDVISGRQIAKLRPDDGFSFDYFGREVAISGSLAIVGAFGDDDNGYRSGSAYLFDVTTGQQVAKLLPINGSEKDEFGGAVAIMDSTAIVGARLENESGLAGGAAYLFDLATGQQIAKLLPSDGSHLDQFAISVAISNTTALVGAFQDDDNGEDSGSAYMFELEKSKVCSGDFNCNGEIEVTDLIEFLLSWGPCDSCLADLDGNGVVDAADLSALLAAWGPCL